MAYFHKALEFLPSSHFEDHRLNHACPLKESFPGVKKGKIPLTSQNANFFFFFSRQFPTSFLSWEADIALLIRIKSQTQEILYLPLLTQ